MCRGPGERRAKGVISLLSAPHTGLGFIPQQLSPGCGGRGGSHPAPRSGLPGRFPLFPRLAEAVRGF